MHWYAQHKLPGFRQSWFAGLPPLQPWRSAAGGSRSITFSWARGIQGPERGIREPGGERAGASGRVGVARLGGERLGDPQALLDGVTVPEPREGLGGAQHAVERPLLPGAEERRQV